MQKVVIPKGLVNPNETTIVEIPTGLKDVLTVVARPRPSSPPPAARAASPPSARANQSSTPPRALFAGGAEGGVPLQFRRKYRRRSHPRWKPQGFQGLDNANYTIGGFPNEEHSGEFPSFQNMGPCPKPVFHPPGSPQWNMSQGDISYSDFDPPVQMGSTLKELHEMDLDRTMYKDFKPWHASPMKGDPGRSPPSLRLYRQDTTSSFDQTPSSYYKQAVTTSTPEEESEEIMEEGPCASSSPSSSPGRRIPQRDVMTSLGELEAVEMSQIVSDLSSYYAARRRLLLDATSLASAAEISSSILSSSG